MKKRLFIIISVSVLAAALLATLIFFAIKKYYLIDDSNLLFDIDDYTENLKEEEKEIEVELNGTKTRLKYKSTVPGWLYRDVSRCYRNESETADGYVDICDVDRYTGKITYVNYTFPANYKKSIENRKISAEERKKNSC